MNWLVLAAFGAVMLHAAPAFAATQRGFIMNEAPKPMPEIKFSDGAGQSRKLADFRGKVVLLNIWATWCVPCRKEMPALDRLQASLGGPGFEAVPLSIDRKGLDAVKKFYAEIGIQHLSMYVDASGAASPALGVVGLPTTFLIDRRGRELGRLIGPAEWDSPETTAFLKRIIAGQAGAPSSTQQQKENDP